MISRNTNQWQPNIEAEHGTATVSITATGLSALVTLHTQTAFVQVQTSHDLRLSVNTTTPTASVGTLVPAGGTIELSRAEADAARLIRAGGSDATIQVAQYK